MGKVPVIVHCADGENSTEGEFDTLADALYHAEEIAKNLIRGHEWVYVGGYTVKGKRSV